MSDPNIIGYLFFLAFGSAIAAFCGNFFRKAKHILGLGYTVIIKIADKEDVRISNVMTTLNTAAIKRIIARTKQEPLPAAITDFSHIQTKEQEIISEATNKIKAQYAINTYHAHAKGYFDYLTNKIDFDNTPGVAIITNVSIDTLVEFINDFYQNQTKGPHAIWFDIFFSQCPPSDEEFILAWAERVILTNRRLIVLTPGTQPTIKNNILIKNITDYWASNG